MNITQSYKGSFSHSKNYNGSPRDYPIDEACADAGRSYFYAPFDCVVKRIYGVGSKGVNTIWIQSTAPVQTPVFTDYVTVMVIHPNDDTLRRLRVGQLFRKGTAMFLEGTDGRATGNHFHISCGTRMSSPRQKNFYLFSNLKWRFLLGLSCASLFCSTSRKALNLCLSSGKTHANTWLPILQ